MNGILNNYGALSAKVKAMYGRRLRYEDFVHMAAMTDVPSVLDYLSRTSWSGAVARLEGTALTRGSLEGALQEEAREEYVRLAAFAPRADRDFLAFPVREAELQAIMTAMRRIKSGRIGSRSDLTGRFLLHSRMDYELLNTCTDYDGILAAASRSIYAKTLRQLYPTGGAKLPEYNLTETLLYIAYYSEMLRRAKRCENGAVRQMLLRGLGEQIDLLNILHILRVKISFPQAGSDFTYLFPFHYRLNSRHLEEMAAAPSPQAVFDLLQGTPYYAAFQDYDVDGVKEAEEYYRAAMYRLHRHQVAVGEPSICTAISYLHLKNAEVSALVTVIESVNYGVAYDDTMARLIGS